MAKSDQIILICYLRIFFTKGFKILEYSSKASRLVFSKLKTQNFIRLIASKTIVIR